MMKIGHMRITKKQVRHLVIYLVLITGAYFMLSPFAMMVGNSFTENVYVIEYPPRIIPEEPSLGNYDAVWNANNFKLYFKNSLVVALSSTVLTLFFSSLGAYAFARFQFKGKEIIFWCLLLVMMIPDLLLIIPRFDLVNRMGIRNTLYGLVIVYVATGVSGQTFFLRGFFEQIPTELEESMLMDGGNYFTIYRRLVLPLSTPVLATSAIFSFMSFRDEYVWALTANTDSAMRTLPVMINSFQGQHGTNWGLVFSAMLIALVPVIIVFILSANYIIGGKAEGAFK
jgi:multiple sugar transport system permease protein